MEQDVVLKIYNLIMEYSSENTFLNNKKLFEEFFYNWMDIYYNGEKVIDIYVYLLSLNIGEYQETMPYLYSKIFDDFNRYIGRLTQSVYMGISIDDIYIDRLINMIKAYEAISKYENVAELSHIMDRETFIRDYTGAMIIILNSSFFDISVDNIKIMMEYIKNNSYLTSIIEEGKMKGRLLDKDYIYQYLTRFLCNAKFLSSENIETDILINAIKDGKITDSDLLIRIFKYIDIRNLYFIFTNGLSSFIDMMDYIGIDAVDKRKIFNLVYAKLLDDEYHDVVLKFVINDNRSSDYISEEDLKNLKMESALDYYPSLSEESLRYLLESPDNGDISTCMVFNLMEIMSRSTWSLDFYDYLNEKAKNMTFLNYSFSGAIKRLDKFFKEGTNINHINLYFILKRIAKEYLGDENLIFGLTYNASINGCAYEDLNIILINIKIIRLLAENPNVEDNPENMHVFDTLMHELRHLTQYRKYGEEDIDDVFYEQYKENILISILNNYYKKNYRAITLEQDARVHGARETSKFLETYFPYMVNCINYYKKKAQDEEEVHYDNKQVFELSRDVSVGEAIDKLVEVNPSILKDYPLLKREYLETGERNPEFLGTNMQV